MLSSSFLSQGYGKNKAFHREGSIFTIIYKPDSVLGYHLSVPSVTQWNQAAYPFRP